MGLGPTHAKLRSDPDSTGRIRSWLLDYGRTWLLILPLWVAIAAQIYFVRRLTGHPLPVATVLAEMGGLLLAMVCLTPLVLWAARQCPLDSRRWKRNLVRHALVMVVFGCLDYLLERTLYLLFHPSFPGSPSLVYARLTFASQSFEGLVATIAVTSPFYILIVVAYYALDYHYAIQEKALRSAEIEVQYSNSRLQALKAQIQPHFLFNALNAIYSHIPSEAETARRMIVLLSTFLRRSLQESGLQQVALRQELEFVSLYLEIQHLRFSNRLSIQMDVDPQTLEAEVPHLILQPLIENAIKHGIGPKTDPGTIAIQARQTSAFLSLSVEDDGIGPRSRATAEKGAGVGLDNLRQRLRHLYGDAGILECGERDGGGFRATVQIPLRRSDKPIAPSANQASEET